MGWASLPAYFYSDFLNLPFTQIIVNENKLKLIIYDVDKEEIVEWID